MAHTGIFATKAEIDLKVGKDVNLDGYTEANINNACAQSESYINAIARYNFSDNYATLNADKKRILSEASACWVAIDFLTYNTASYANRIVAEDMINVNWAKFQELKDQLIDQKVVTFINEA